ncbi:MAG: ATP-grasp domain-containing protein [Eubacterium sp.]|nr:ATP-grasp domain-containing protein [Eubacterium sp.]
MQHRLVIIGSLEENIALVRHSKERGYYTIVCDGYPDGPAKKFADKVYNINVRDDRAIAEMCRKEEADGIIGSFSDLLLEQITRIADRAGIRWYLKPDQIPYYREKNAAKDLMERQGIHVPRHTVLKADFQDRELSGFSMPLVVKPVNGWGSKGIYVVRSTEEIRSLFQDIAGRSSGMETEIEVEEFSKGREYNMMTWVIDGEVHVISIADREKNPQEGNALPLLNRLCYPAAAVRKILPEAKAVLEKYIAATGQKNGALSMQFFYNEHGVEVCEIAARLFGYEHEMVTICSGFDIEDMLLNYVYDTDALKAQFRGHSPYFDKYCAGLYFVGRQDMEVYDLQTAEELARDEHVIFSQIFYKKGEKIDNYGPNPYLTRYYVTGKDRAEVDRVTEDFFQKFSVRDREGREVAYSFRMEKD